MKNNKKTTTTRFTGGFTHVNEKKFPEYIIINKRTGQREQKKVSKNVFIPELKYIGT